VLRKGLADDEDEAEEIARNIQRKIATFGTEPRHFMEWGFKRSLPYLGRELDVELSKI
jgi:hypothetical protein